MTVFSLILQEWQEKNMALARERATEMSAVITGVSEEWKYADAEGREQAARRQRGELNEPVEVLEASK